MAETSKYDFFIDEINALEKQIYYFIQKGDELLDANEDLSKKITNLEQENEALKKRITDIETKLSKTILNEENLFDSDSLNLEEREVLRNKISELINKIDYHLRS